MKCCLLVDHRERMVIQHAEKYWQDIMYEIQTLTVGDYILIDNQRHPLAIIERKTYEDFAASIKDARINNRNKLYDFARDYPGCRVYFLIEGVAVPNRETYGGIKWSKLHSCLTHMTLRDGICVMYTGKDELTNNSHHTARYLANFCKDTHTLLSNNPEYCSMVSKMKCLQDVKIPLTLPEIEEEVIEAWRAIKGIGPKKARSMMKLYTLAQYIDENKPDLEVKSAILKKIRGISKTSAQKLLEHIIRKNLPFQELSRKDLSDFQINGRRLGVKGEKIHQIINYRNTDSSDVDLTQEFSSLVVRDNSPRESDDYQHTQRKNKYSSLSSPGKFRKRPVSDY